LARFVVLKNGVNFTVFDFDGNIARIGSGGTEDLRLDDTGIDGDLFFLTKRTDGYEIEKRSESFDFTVNGESTANRVSLKDGDKVAFLNYLIVAQYSKSAPAAPSPKSSAPSVGPKDTAPNVQQSVAKPVVSQPAPKPAERGNRETVIIDSAALFRAAQQSSTQSASSAEKVERQTTPNRVVERPKQVVSEQKSVKPSITPIYSFAVLTGQHKGKTIPIDKAEFIVGRERSCDLVLDRDESGDQETSVSRQHFVLHSADDGLFITDKRSQLRTFVNHKVMESDQREYIAPEDIISAFRSRQIGF
jgi:predicted component of type VI protein secretion system